MFFHPRPNFGFDTKNTKKDLSNKIIILIIILCVADPVPPAIGSYSELFSKRLRTFICFHDGIFGSVYSLFSLLVKFLRLKAQVPVHDPDHENVPSGSEI